MARHNDEVESLVEQAVAVVEGAGAKLQSLSQQVEALYRRELSEWLEKEQALAATEPAAGADDGESHRPAETNLRERHSELDERLSRLRALGRRLELVIRRNEDSSDYLRSGQSAVRMADLKEDLPSVRVIQSQEEEGYRLAQELQDSAAQLLANAVFELEVCYSLLDSDPQAVKEGVLSLKEELRAGLAQVRRLVADLQPPLLLSELGLAASLERYARSYAEHFGIEVQTRLENLTERLPATVETAIFRILQEAMLNACRYAEASHVTVDFRNEGEHLIFTVEDDGRGLSGKWVASERTRGLGLIGMRDRAELLRGRLQVIRKHDRGTRLILSVPHPFA